MKTKLIRSTYNIRQQHRGGVVTIGNFDGVHIGHQALLSRTVLLARSLKVPAIVVTFEPHAFEFFGGDNVTIPRLTRMREKFYHLAESGVDAVLILKFNQQLAGLSASDFVSKILYEGLAPKHILVGDDFRFGAKRQGDISLLAQMGQTLGFTVESMPTFLLDGERVSSTRVRTALAQGDHVQTNRLLGRPFSLMGIVRHGDKLGRQLGFPTANIYLHRKLTPVKGIYAVYMHGIADHPLPGAANVGTRPTVDGTRTLLEVHLLNFNQEIYGRDVEVEFCKKLRDEVRYPNLAELQAQIAKDVVAVSDYFKTKTKD